MSDKNKGLYPKYKVWRRHDPNGKHNYCDYFVLDWQHDKYTIPAMEAYAKACQSEFPHLANDIYKLIERFKHG